MPRFLVQVNEGRLYYAWKGVSFGWGNCLALALVSANSVLLYLGRLPSELGRGHEAGLPTRTAAPVLWKLGIHSAGLELELACVLARQLAQVC